MLRRAALVFALLAAAACAARRPAPAPAKTPAGPPPIPAAVTVALSTGATAQELLSGIEAAYRAGRYDDGLRLVRRTLETGDNLAVYDRVGSIYLLLGRYGEAISFWEQALKREKRPPRRRALEGSILMARRSLGLPDPPPEPGVPRPKPRPKPRKPQVDKKASERSYDQGVSYYAKGEYLQATANFMRALELDPDNALAKSALERLKLKPGVNAAAPDTAKNGNPG